LNGAIRNSSLIVQDLTASHMIVVCQLDIDIHHVFVV
jgi:hypothetical protein